MSSIGYEPSVGGYLRNTDGARAHRKRQRDSGFYADYSSCSLSDRNHQSKIDGINRENPPAMDGFKYNSDSNTEQNRRRNSCQQTGGGIRAPEQSNDMAVILPLILLLMTEKADFKLIFALMYILM